MFRTLLWKEIREHLMTFRFGAALVVTFVLVVVSAWVLGNDYQRRRDTYNKLAETADQQLEETFVVSQLMPVIHRPPSKLSIFAQGDEKRLGNSVEIRRWSVPAQASDSLTDNLFLAGMASFDLLSVFTFIISLFGILICYDAVSGERERGVLRQLCSYTAGRRTIYISKFVAGVVVLSLPVVLSFICAMLVLQFVHNIVFSAVQWSAVGLMLLGGIIYGALFVAVGLCCSALLKRSSTALVLSLLFWTLGTVLIPCIANSLAKSFVQLPSPAEVHKLEQVTREENRNKVSDFFRTEFPNGLGGMMISFGQGIQVFEASSVERWKGFGKYVRYNDPLWQERAEEIWELNNKHLSQKSKQLQTSDNLSFPAPAFHLRSIFTGLAKTDYQTYADFMNRARRYRGTFMKGLRDRGYFGDNAIGLFSRRTNEDITEEKVRARIQGYRERMNSGEDFREVLGFEQFGPLPSDLIPPFEYNFEEPDFAGRLLPLGVLFFMVSIFFLIGFISFLRYDVR